VRSWNHIANLKAFWIEERKGVFGEKELIKELKGLRDRSEHADELTLINFETGEIYPPGQNTPENPDYGWYLLGEDVSANPDMITAEHKGRKYVLLSRKPKEVLLSSPEGNIDWRIIKSDVEKAPEWDAWSVKVTFDKPGGEALARLTGDHIDRKLAIVVDDVVIAMPTIRTKIRNECQITGNFTEAEVKLLADYLSPAEQDSEPSKNDKK
jgi:hypothetical protein